MNFIRGIATVIGTVILVVICIGLYYMYTALAFILPIVIVCYIVVAIVLAPPDNVSRQSSTSKLHDSNNRDRGD